MPFSGWQDLNPELATRLQALIAASPYKFVPISGNRTTKRQTELWNAALKKYGSAEVARKWVAPPGHSRHEKGAATDLGMADGSKLAGSAAAKWLRANAAQFGLHIPLSNEDWHVELAGSRGGAATSAYGRGGGQASGKVSAAIQGALQGSAPRSGGSRSWRNQNPGNIRYGAFAKANGATGQDKDGFAIFASEEAGTKAQIALLRGRNYNNLTLQEAINRYSPAADKNNPTQYAAALSAKTGIPIGATLSSLSDQQMVALVGAMRQHEGWKVGTGGSAAPGAYEAALMQGNPGGAAPQTAGYPVSTPLVDALLASAGPTGVSGVQMQQGQMLDLQQLLALGQQFAGRPLNLPDSAPLIGQVNSGIDAALQQQLGGIDQSIAQQRQVIGSNSQNYEAQRQAAIQQLATISDRLIATGKAGGDSATARQAASDAAQVAGAASMGMGAPTATAPDVAAGAVPGLDFLKGSMADTQGQMVADFANMRQLLIQQGLNEAASTQVALSAAANARANDSKNAFLQQILMGEHSARTQYALGENDRLMQGANLGMGVTQANNQQINQQNSDQLQIRGQNIGLAQGDRSAQMDALGAALSQQNADRSFDYSVQQDQQQAAFQQAQFAEQQKQFWAGHKLEQDKIAETIRNNQAKNDIAAAKVGDYKASIPKDMLDRQAKAQAKYDSVARSGNVKSITAAKDALDKITDEVEAATKLAADMKGFYTKDMSADELKSFTAGSIDIEGGVRAREKVDNWRSGDDKAKTQIVLSGSPSSFVSGLAAASFAKGEGYVSTMDADQILYDYATYFVDAQYPSDKKTGAAADDAAARDKIYQSMKTEYLQKVGGGSARVREALDARYAQYGKMPKKPTLPQTQAPAKKKGSWTDKFNFGVPSFPLTGVL